ncbi:hypothetical protein LXL04_032622 [Taraxacum kok-saghyz]
MVVTTTNYSTTISSPTDLCQKLRRVEDLGNFYTEGEEGLPEGWSSVSRSIDSYQIGSSEDADDWFHRRRRRRRRLLVRSRRGCLHSSVLASQFMVMSSVFHSMAAVRWFSPPRRRAIHGRRLSPMVEKSKGSSAGGDRRPKLHLRERTEKKEMEMCWVNQCFTGFITGALVFAPISICKAPNFGKGKFNDQACVAFCPNLRKF